MSQKLSHEFHQSNASDSAPAVGRLASGRAISLCWRQAGVLRVVQGRVWLTFDSTQSGFLHNLGDYFLDAGETLAIGPGQRLVLESWERKGENPGDACACFEWVCLPVRQAAWRQRLSIKARASIS